MASTHKAGGQGETSAVRLDVWLWATRFFKTRALAKVAIEAARVEVDGAAAKPALSEMLQTS